MLPWLSRHSPRTVRRTAHRPLRPARCAASSSASKAAEGHRPPLLDQRPISGPRRPGLAVAEQPSVAVCVASLRRRRAGRRSTPRTALRAPLGRKLFYAGAHAGLRISGASMPRSLIFSPAMVIVSPSLTMGAPAPAASPHGPAAQPAALSRPQDGNSQDRHRRMPVRNSHDHRRVGAYCGRRAPKATYMENNLLIIPN